MIVGAGAAFPHKRAFRIEPSFHFIDEQSPQVYNTLWYLFYCLWDAIVPLIMIWGFRVASKSGQITSTSLNKDRLVPLLLQPDKSDRYGARKDTLDILDDPPS